ncbi:MAG: M48 family metallopeptidase, partial [Caulobacteraceae bacterium]|nr:M48 family metallopeptidase [Caulobacter sp.]
MRLPFLSSGARAPRLQAGDLVEVAGAPVRLAVNPRARRVGLRLSRATREVVATAPSRTRLAEALAFAHARADWIAARLAELPQGMAFAPGAVVPVRGAPCVLERAAMRVAGSLRPSADGEPQRLVASGEGEAFARAVQRVLRREALGELTDKTRALAARLGEAAPVVSVADARGRWGSCRPSGRGEPGRIRYTWRLVCAPTPVLDYVVAHEAAHLREPNHGAGFWALNRELYG